MLRLILGRSDGLLSGLGITPYIVLIIAYRVLFVVFSISVAYLLTFGMFYLILL